jgi:ribonuclease P protein component
VPDGIWRIGDRKTFEALRVAGRPVRVGPITVVHLSAEDDDGRVRLAFAVGRRVGSAVVRNRVRRRIRAVVTGLVREGVLAPGAYLVVVAPPGATLPYAQLAAIVASALRRVGRGVGEPR